MVQFAHCKYRYAWCANLFLNHDVDELLVMYQGLTMDNIYSQLMNSNAGGLIYGCQNMDPYNERLGKDAHYLGVDEIQYKDYYYWGMHINNREIYGEGSFAKWF